MHGRDFVCASLSSSLLRTVVGGGGGGGKDGWGVGMNHICHIYTHTNSQSRHCSHYRQYYRSSAYIFLKGG